MKDRSYGILVRNATIGNCLNKKFEEDVDGSYDLTNIFASEIESEVLEVGLNFYVQNPLV